MVRPSASRIATPATLPLALLALSACGAAPEPTTVPEAPPPAPAAALAGPPAKLNPPTTPVPVTTPAPAAAAPAAAEPAPAASAPAAPEAAPPPIAAQSPAAEAPSPAAPPPAAPPIAAEVAADVSRPHPALSAPGRRVAAPRGRLAPPPPRSAPLAVAPSAKPAPVADGRPARLAALQRALGPAVRAGAVLRAPASFASGAPAEVTLTLPAGLAATVRAEAGRVGLPQAATSVNLTARLAGDGYAVTPDQPQAQPLIAGQPTRFAWKVAAAPDAKGPLAVAVGAQLLGAGNDGLELTRVAAPQAPGVFPASRFVGLGLLVVLVVAALAWLDRRRRRPKPRPLPTPLRRAA